MMIRKVSLTLLYLFFLLISLAFLYYKNVSESSLYDIYVDNLISSNFRKAFPELNIVIGKTQVLKDTDGYAITLYGTLIRNNSEEVVGKIPKIYAHVSLKSFFSKSVIKSLYIESPQLLSWSQHGSFSTFDFYSIIGNLAENVESMEINDFALAQDIKIQSIHFSSAGEDGKNKINIHIKKDDNSSIQAEVKVSSNTIISLYFSNLDLSFSKMIPKEYQDITLSGYSTIALDKLMRVKSGNVVINNVSGPFKSGYGKLVINPQAVKIENLTLGIDESDVLISGEYNYVKNSVNLDIKSQSMQASTAFNIWPRSLKEKARLWCEEHIIGGMLIEPALHVEGIISQNHHSSFDSYFTDGSFITDEIFAPLTSSNGRLSIQDNELFVHVNRALIDEITVVDAIIKQEDMKSPNSPLYIYGSTESETKALYPLIEDGKSLDFLANINGIAHSDFSFVVLDDVIENYFNVALYKSYSDSFLDMLQLSDGNAELNVNNDCWELYGDMHVENHAVNILAHGHRKEAKVHLDGEFSASVAVKFNILKDQEIAGKLVGDVNITHINNYNYIDGRFDLSNSVINLHNIEWYTDIGEQNYLDFYAINQGNLYIIPEFRISGKGVQIDGMTEVKDNKLAKLILPNIKIGNNKIESIYSKENKREKLLLKADQLSLDTMDNNGFSPSDTKLEVKASIGNATLKNDISIFDLQIKINPNYIDSYIYGEFASNQSFFIKNTKDELLIWSDDAGSFLSGLGINSSVDRGSMLIQYNHKNKYGNFLVKNFYLVETPVLAKILSLVSLQGIVDTLNNEGIYFNQLNAPFVYNNNIISFNESWLEGLSLGISFEGQVDITSRKVNMKGHVVPIYYLNKMIWQIPLFGPLLTGGKGRGIISIDYNLETDEDGENQISVNMMSILTPKLIQRVLEIL